MTVSIETSATTGLCEDMIMRNRLTLTKWALGACLLGWNFASLPTARADLRWVETVDVVPTASVVELPRTYLVPSSYVVPRSYVTTSSVIVPTTLSANVYDVMPTAYYVPTAYVSSRYYRAFRPRRYVETTYVSSYPTSLTPTYYLSPTTYLSSSSFVTSTGLVATSSDLCCEMAAAPAMRVAPNPGMAAPSETQKSADAFDRRPGAILNSTVADGPNYSTEANRPVRDDSLNTTKGMSDPLGSSGTRNALPGNGSDLTRDPLKSSAVGDPNNSGSTSATFDPIKPKETATVKDVTGSPSAPITKTAPTTKPLKESATKGSVTLDPKTAIPPPISPTPPVPTDPDPIAPGSGEPPAIESIPGFPDAKPEVGGRRNSYKPVVPSTPGLRPKRNILEGKIVSADSLNPEENVEVVITDRSGRYIDRTTRTNAFGQFAITLPEGDWTIKVTMPSGRTLAVGQGQVTAAAGKIIDMYGRDLANLVIKR